MSAIRICSLSGKGVCLLRVQIQYTRIRTLLEGDLQLRAKEER